MNALQREGQCFWLPSQHSAVLGGESRGRHGGAREETVLPAHMSLPVPMVPWAPPEGPSRCEEMRHLSVSQAQGLPQA